MPLTSFAHRLLPSAVCATVFLAVSPARPPLLAIGVVFFGLTLALLARSRSR